MKTNDIAIVLPPSKSISLRSLILKSLHPKVSFQGHLSDADDVNVLRRLLRDLSSLEPAEENIPTLYCGQSAAAARFMLAILATRPGSVVILDGDPQLRRRPLAPLVDALRSLGGNKIEYLGAEGCLPVRIEGGEPIMKLVEIDPSMSGQYVSALLLAAAATPRGLHVRMTHPPASRPYIEMTCAMLERAGAPNDYAPNHTTIRQQPFDSYNTTRPLVVERDWSAAAFFYTAALLLPHRRMRLVNLNLDSLQGDCVAADIFRQLGVSSKEARSPYRNSRSLLIEGGGEMRNHLIYDFSDCPDLVMPVAVSCAAMGIEAHLSGLKTLRYKECDRLQALDSELKKMGAIIESKEESLHIIPSVLKPEQTVCTYGDHRIAMAFGTLRILFPDLKIDHPEVVTKSFPDFWNQLDQIVNSI